VISSAPGVSPNSELSHYFWLARLGTYRVTADQVKETSNLQLGAGNKEFSTLLLYYFLIYFELKIFYKFKIKSFFLLF